MLGWRPQWQPQLKWHECWRGISLGIWVFHPPPKKGHRGNVNVSAWRLTGSNTRHVLPRLLNVRRERLTKPIVSRPGALPSTLRLALISAPPHAPHGNERRKPGSRQLRGTAEGRQAEGARVGITANQGLFGHGSAVLLTK